MNDSGSYTHPLITFCESADRRGQEFHDELALFEKNSEEWNAFLKSTCDSDNNLLQITAFEVIRKSGDSGWLDYLFARLQTETMPTNFGPIVWAIGELGGFQSREDYAHYFEATDENMRHVAMDILDILPDEDAIEMLLKILKQDPAPALRRSAAYKLANFGSDAGLQLLLDDFDSPENRSLFGQLHTACALSMLKNPKGLHFLDNLIKSHLILSKQSRTTLLFFVCGFCVDVGLELPPCDRPADLPVELIFRTATEWIEAHS